MKSITDPAGATINYDFDSLGRTSAVSGSSFGGVTQYASNMKYRAWNALKGMSYGNGKTASLTYNSRLNPTHFEVPGVMVKDYQYHNDGRLKFSGNSLDNKFDRSYGYDHLGRISEAFSGPLARGEADTTNRPYKQYYQYDAMNQLVGRVGSKMWSAPASLTTYTYANNRNINWQYDADGHHISGGGIQYAYDAAAETISVVSNSGNRTQTQTFDGDSQPTKQVESVTEDNGFGTMVTTITTRYIVVSSILGEVITDLDQTGQKTRSLVYSGGQVLAWQEKASGSESVLWEYRDPSNASYRMALANGTSDSSRLAEMDPLGANAGGQNPFVVPPQRWPREDLTYPAFADLISGDCRIDGIPAPCGMTYQALHSGAAAQCPNNNCGRCLSTTAARLSFKVSESSIQIQGVTEFAQGNGNTSTLELLA